MLSKCKHRSKRYPNAGKRKSGEQTRQNRERDRRSSEKKADIEICYRVPVPNSANKNLLSSSRAGRNETVLEKARKDRLTTRDLRFSAMTPVYVNGHLWPEIKKLLGQTTDMKKRKLEVCLA